MVQFPLITLLFFLAPCLLGGAFGVFWLKEAYSVRALYAFGAYLASTLALGLWGFTWFFRYWWLPFHRFKRNAEQVAIGHKIPHRKKRVGYYWKSLHLTLIELERQFDELIDFATSLSKQKFEAELSERLQNTPFAKRLNDVRQKLYEKQVEEEHTNWTMRGLADFSDILRNSEHLELETLSSFFLRHLVKYLKAQQGVLYLLNALEGEEDDTYLRLTAHYAVSKADFDNKRVETDEGITGECFTKRKRYYIQDVKDDYSPVFSGLGAGSARSLLIFPIALADKTWGVLEMASWEYYAPYQLDFLETICQNFAVVVDSFYMQAQTKKLLHETEKANQELLAQEAEMKRNSHELEIIQQELNQKLLIIEEETTFLKYILQAIDKTNAMLEFDIEGTIIEANEMYLSVMGYRSEDIVGKNERMLLPAEDRTSERYDLMWETLRAGNFISGEYKRIAKDGREIWLNGTYNPIFDVEGKPTRIIKLAQFTTEDKERDLQQKSKIEALTQTLMVLHVSPQGIVKSTNSNFLEHFEVSRSQMREATFSNLLEQSSENTHNFETIWQKALAGGTPPPQTLAYQPKGDAVSKAITYCSPIRSLDNKLSMVLIVLVDATLIENEQARANAREDELKTKNIELEQILQAESNLTAMLWRMNMAIEFDAQSNIIRFNEPFLQKTQTSPNIAQSPFSKLLRPSVSKAMLEKLWQELQEKGRLETVLKYRMPQNNGFWGRTTFLACHPNGTQEKRYLAIVEDVSDQVLKEVYLGGELVELKLKNTSIEFAPPINGKETDWQTLPPALQKVQESPHVRLPADAPIGHFTIDSAGKISHTNLYALNLLGYKKGDLAGKDLQDLLVFQNDDQRLELLAKLRNNSKGFAKWLVIDDHNGRGVYANALVKPQDGAQEVFFVVP